MNKYRHVFLIGLQSNLVYRWNFMIRGLFSVFHLIVVFTLWHAAYSGQGRIGGFNLGQTLTYFVLLLVLQFMIAAFNEDYQISEEIRNGLINQFLLKPINYYLYRLFIFIAARAVTGTMILIPLALLYPFIGKHLTLPHEGWRLALGLPALMMAASIQFTIAYCFGLITFWLLEIQGLVILSLAVESFFGGQIIPLDLLPPALFRITQLLPFYYQMYFPAAVFSGRLEFDQCLEGLAWQAGWVVALYGLAQLLWTRGLRRYTAVGG